MRIVELPLPLSPDGRLAVAALVARDNRMNVGWELHLGSNYDFTGPVDATSYSVLANHNRFAQFGRLLADYGAGTRMIDDMLGFTVRLLGPDIILDEQSAFTALANELLVFIGDEIMSVVGVELLAAATYRVFVIRARLTSDREAHEEGDAVYLIRRDDLLPFTHDQVQIGNELSFKLVMQSNSVAQDLSVVEEITHTVTGVMLFQLVPSNLRVNGQLRNAIYGATDDIRLDWSLPAARADVAAINVVKFRTLVEIVSLVDDRVLWSKLTYASTLKILTARMAVILEGETSFKARISTDGRGRDFQFNSTTIELNATQV